MKNRDIPAEMAEDLLNLFYEKTYQIKKGINFGGCHLDEASDIISRSLFLAGHESITLKISKAKEKRHININIEEVNESN